MTSIFLLTETNRQINSTNSDTFTLKKIYFFGIFLCICDIYIKFWTFSKKRMNLTGDVFSKLQTPKNVIR